MSIKRDVNDLRYSSFCVGKKESLVLFPFCLPILFCANFSLTYFLIRNSILQLHILYFTRIFFCFYFLLYNSDKIRLSCKEEKRSGIYSIYYKIYYLRNLFKIVFLSFCESYIIFWRNIIVKVLYVWRTSKILIVFYNHSSLES